MYDSLQTHGVVWLGMHEVGVEDSRSRSGRTARALLMRPHMIPGVVLQSEKYYEVRYFLLRMRMRLHRDRLPNYNTTRALQHDHYYRLTRELNS